MQKLPVELISNILLKGLPRPDVSVDPITSHDPLWSYRSAILSTCTFWRDIAYTIPDLWQDVVIRLSNTGHTTTLDELGLSLDLSQGKELDVVIYGDVTSSEVLLPLWTHLLHERSRICTLDVLLDHAMYPEILPLPGNWNYLVFVSLREGGRTIHRDSAPWPLTMHTHAPSLRSLFIAGLSMTQQETHGLLEIPALETVTLSCTVHHFPYRAENLFSLVIPAPAFCNLLLSHPLPLPNLRLLVLLEEAHISAELWRNGLESLEHIGRAGLSIGEWNIFLNILLDDEELGDPDSSLILPSLRSLDLRFMGDPQNEWADSRRWNLTRTLERFLRSRPQLAIIVDEGRWSYWIDEEFLGRIAVVREHVVGANEYNIISGTLL
ncbi:hypothetical protein DL93DRAFT_828342 [Clavulina sp. PMI_390]|nr:hypothetical protein DL93DRAFT_828342 [Clavulina sp. PMI_390]